MFYSFFTKIKSFPYFTRFNINRCYNSTIRIMICRFTFYPKSDKRNFRYT